MNRTLQILLALTFVVVLGAVLIQPILDAVDSTDPVAAPTDEGDPSKASPEHEATEEPEAEPTTRAAEGTRTGAIEGPLRTRPLFDAYPSRCLEPVPPVRDRVVFVRHGLAETATRFESTPAQGRIGAVGLVGLDAGAQTFATYVRPRDVFFSAWEGVAGADGQTTGAPVRLAAWSPISSCGLTATDPGKLRVVPEGAVLVREDVSDFAYSVDGHRVALVLEEGPTTALWVAALDGRRMREVYRTRSSAPVALLGWDTGGRTVFFSSGRPSSVRSITTTKTPRTTQVTTGRVDAPEHCPDRVIAIVEGSIAEITRGGPVFLTDLPPGRGYSAVACAPNGAFLAAIRDGSLELLTANGQPVRDLTPEVGYRDVFVDWGDGGAGVLFGRLPDGGGAAQIWHIPEGGTPRDTGLRYDHRARAVDWSASPPTGLP